MPTVYKQVSKFIDLTKYNLVNFVENVTRHALLFINFYKLTYSACASKNLTVKRIRRKQKG